MLIWTYLSRGLASNAGSNTWSAPSGFNPIANVPPERRALAASGMMSAFKPRLYTDDRFREQTMPLAARPF